MVGIWFQPIILTCYKNTEFVFFCESTLSLVMCTEILWLMFYRILFKEGTLWRKIFFNVILNMKKHICYFYAASFKNMMKKLNFALTYAQQRRRSKCGGTYQQLFMPTSMGMVTQKNSCDHLLASLSETFEKWYKILKWPIRINIDKSFWKVILTSST